MKSLLQVDAASERNILSDFQDAVQCAFNVVYDDEKQTQSANSEESRDEPAEEWSCNLRDLQGTRGQGAPVLQTFCDLYTKYDVDDLDTLGEVQSIIKDESSSIQSVFKLSTSSTK